MASADLEIYMGGRKVGLLHGSDPRSLRITYDAGWFEDPGSNPLSVAMPLTVTKHLGAVVEPYLWGLLPDDDRVLARWAADYHVSARNVVALLRHVGTDVAGAAQYVPYGESPEEADPGSVEPVDVADVAALLREVRTDSAAWHSGRRPGRWSLAGAQGKLALAYDASSDQWAIPRGSAPTTHILKPAIEGRESHDLNEHLCLAVARRVGLRSAFTEVREFDNERALVVRRYDRVVTNAGDLVRVHQADFCQALSIHPTRKYESDGGPGVEDMAALIRETSLVDPAGDVQSLCRAVAFNWLLLATDAHAKNYSLLLAGPQVRLAPLYDIASALPYGDHPRKLRLAHKVGGENRPVFIHARHWERLAHAVRIDADGLRHSIIAMIDQIPDALSDAVRATPVSGVGGDMVTRLVDQLPSWLDACRRAMR